MGTVKTIVNSPNVCFRMLIVKTPSLWYFEIAVALSRRLAQLRNLHRESVPDEELPDYERKWQRDVQLSARQEKRKDSRALWTCFRKRRSYSCEFTPTVRSCPQTHKGEASNYLALQSFGARHTWPDFLWRNAQHVCVCSSTCFCTPNWVLYRVRWNAEDDFGNTKQFVSCKWTHLTVHPPNLLCRTGLDWLIVQVGF